MKTKILISLIMLLILFLASSGRCEDWVLDQTFSTPSNVFVEYTPKNVHIKIVSSGENEVYQWDFSPATSYGDPPALNFCGQGTFEGDLYGLNGLRIHIIIGDVKIYYNPSNPTNKHLTVTDGITSGDFLPGASCSISPTIPPGMSFSNWTASNCVLNGVSTLANNSIIMPSNDCSVTAHFSTAPPNGGLIVVNGSGSVTIVTLGQSYPIAYIPSSTGKTFKEWSPYTGVTAKDSANTSITILESMTIPYTVTAIENDGTTETGGTADNPFHIIVDNFSELTAIITTPLINRIEKFSDDLRDLLNDNTRQIIEGLASVGDSLNNTLLGIDNSVKSLGDKIDSVGTKIDITNLNLSTIDTDLNNGLNQVNQNLVAIDTDMNYGFYATNENLGKIDINGQVTNDKLSDIIDLMKKTSSGVTSGGGSVPSSDIDGSDFDTPSDAFSINKLDASKQKIYSKFNAYFHPALSSPNNAFLVLPLSQIPGGSYHHLQDVPVKFFDNPTLMPFIALVRQILVCGIYASTIYAIIRVVRTWEHK